MNENLNTNEPMKLIKNLLNLLFKSEKVTAPAPPPAKIPTPPMFEDNVRASFGRAASARPNGNHYRLPGTARNNSIRAASGRHDLQTSRSHIGTRNAEELLREGHLRIGLVGFNRGGFVVDACARWDDAGLAKEIANLAIQVKMVPHRDIAGGLRVALQMLSRSPQGRSGIVVLTSGQPTMNSALATELVQTAIKWRTGVHVIQIGRCEERTQALANLTTRSVLVYGQFRKAGTRDDLLEAIRGALDGVSPARAMTGINSAVILVDCSEQMVESFQGTTRIEMVEAALKEYLQNPLIRESERKLALAA